jgi:adenylate cyclase
VLSRLGAATHQHITATGDTVNVASRLLEVAKERKAGIVVSEDLARAASRATREALGQGEAAASEAVIRGRVQPLAVRLWELRN